MKYLIVAFFCVTTFTAASAQTVSPVHKVVVLPSRMNTIAFVPKPQTVNTVYDPGPCCHCLYCLAFEIPRIQPAVDMYIRHYFGLNYWD